MNVFFLCLVELFALVILSHFVNRYVFYCFTALFRSARIARTAFALLFLPGTFIHELSHFLAAVLLFVPVGKFTLLPQQTAEGMRLGSVAIARCDIVRRVLIGVAPIFAGTGVLVGSVVGTSYWEVPFPWQYLFVGYIAFTVGNTLFSSRKDLEGTVEFVAASIIVIAVLFVLGFEMPIDVLTLLNTSQVTDILQQIQFALLWPIGADAMFLLIYSFLRRK